MADPLRSGGSLRPFVLPLAAGDESEADSKALQIIFALPQNRSAGAF